MAAITIDSEDLTVVGNVMSLDITKGALPKPVFGQQWRNTAGGQLTGAVTISGHMSVEITPLLLPLIESEAAVAISIYIGEEGGAIDAGSNDGLIVITGLSESTDAEGEWEFTLDGELDGPLAFTAPTP